MRLISAWFAVGFRARLLERFRKTAPFLENARKNARLLERVRKIVRLLGKRTLGTTTRSKKRARDGYTLEETASGRLNARKNSSGTAKLSKKLVRDPSDTSKIQLSPRRHSFFHVFQFLRFDRCRDDFLVPCISRFCFSRRPFGSSWTHLGVLLAPHVLPLSISGRPWTAKSSKMFEN